MKWLRRIVDYLDPPEAPKHPMSGMVFKSSEAFLDYHCLYGNTSIRQGIPCYAVVISDYSDLAARSTGTTNPDPLERVFMIGIAANGQTITKFAAHNQRKGMLQVGDLVAWMPVAKRNDKDTSWEGALVALCAPEFNDHGVKVITYF